MANLMESYGLGFLDEDEETRMGIVGYVVSKGKTFSSYSGAPYVYMPMGRVEFWVGTEKDGPEKFYVSQFHTHCAGNHIWEMCCTGIDLSPKSSPRNERILMLKPCASDGGMLPVDLFNADVLPSFLKGDRIKLQIAAPCLDVRYYATEDEYADAQPADKRGKKWLLSDGALMALSFLSNHMVGNYEEGKEYEDDIFVTFKATVKALWQGAFELEGQSMDTFIRCVADTQFGELEFHHSLEQVPEEQRGNVRIGSVITGTCILSADTAIEEYANGIVKDHDHDLRLLRQAFQKGEAERLRSVLAENCVYESDVSGCRCRGADEIIDRLNYVAENREGEYFAHSAEITQTDEGLEFPIGTRCIVLAAEDEDHYESIVFVTADPDGNIQRIKVSTDGGYRFRIERPERAKTPLDDIGVPGSVAEPILARAKFHGFLGREIEYDRIVEDPLYSSHAENARRMLDALRADLQPDAVQAVKYILGYLFAKAVEMTVNEEREDPELNMKLTASYSPYDALRGRLATTLAPEEHTALENEAELARQFGNDMFYYLEANDLSEEDFEETFIQAAVVVQRIGQLYAENGFEGTKEGN